MTNALKGLLFSALVFPGLGQVVLKRFLRGIVFILITTAGLIYFALEAVLITWGVMEKMATDVTDPEQLLAATQKALTEADWSGLWGGLIVMVAAWIIGAADAYVVGRAMDRSPADNRSTDDSG